MRRGNERLDDRLALPGQAQADRAEGLAPSSRSKKDRGCHILGAVSDLSEMSGEGFVAALAVSIVVLFAGLFLYIAVRMLKDVFR